MANTYSQSYFHLVFAVKNRDALIKKSWKDELEMYITGIIRNNKHKLLAINSMPDHIHLLIGYNLNQLIPFLVEQIKTSSNAWIKYNGLTRFKFEWQKGYGAFTQSHKSKDRVIEYIANQQIHHQKVPFREEYLKILQKNELQFSDDYLFDFFDDLAIG